jgi:protein TonB
MRTYTLLFSIAAHACAACALLFTTVLATADLPAPHDASTFVNIVATPPPAPPPAARGPNVDPAPRSDAAPLAAPDGIRDEVDRLVPIDVAEANSNGVVGGFGNDPGIAIRDEPPPPAPAAQPAPSRVGGAIKPPRKIQDVAPVYPELARTARVSGVVIIEAMIDEQGRVQDARVLRSIPLLDAAAIDAVRRWRFTPTVLNGEAIPVVMTVTVNFRLN